MHAVGRSPPIQPRFRNFHGNLSSNFPKDFKSLVEVGPISRKDVIRSKNLETPFDAQLTKLAAIGEEVVEQDFTAIFLQPPGFGEELPTRAGMDSSVLFPYGSYELLPARLEFLLESEPLIRPK